ncbi:type I restriction endonuclease subunit R [Salmonella enterica subsp. enterica serovar Javiana]|uniref:Type I restriction endonuclease subunit R n=1 Tax=Salmonella newport TaxID=108619 RepID=A0A5U9VG26_SALNE|nr:type I restriction endonuclease subunit R [Salmonella enterica subsp. enterica]EAY8715170.1 type I restriction endonuclease subunit R [Salmonella enterica]EBS4544802.1 type I restriction endonuclease subunit R [Salmonella enterica subsp. enterica serovar Newport]ECI2264773.1 type I restriction endonuclease subunit R [Salmonella enterica subsp. enterica serovar Wandsworth]EDH7692054.1 type I restriction endonuclease subunit R [Salmonella enterica subsp. enterica serovar Stanley]EEI9451721.1 
MENFKTRLKSHVDHVKSMGGYCTTEETTKQALIVPFLDILGFSAYDPRKVKAEYSADFPGVKANERVDYALFCQDVPVMFIEAKSFSEDVNNHCPQLSRYFNSTPEVTISAITNGMEWRFFTDLKQKNIMDDTPFLRLRMDSLSDSDAEQLYRFRYDKFKPEALRTLAEESVYLTAFTKTISTSLRDVDNEFVKYIASRSNIERQLNQKFLDAITPLVKLAVEKAVSAMVVSGLASIDKERTVDTENKANGVSTENGAEPIDQNNPDELSAKRKTEVFNKVKQIVGEQYDMQYKDTESYFGIMYEGKTNRWLIRYFDKREPYVMFRIDLTDVQLNEISRAGLEVVSGRVHINTPDDVLRVSGIVMDAFEFVKNDENFRKSTRPSDGEE